MSVLKLSGGLGNQLFQVAFAMAIAKSTGKPVGLDTSFYSTSRSEDDRNLQVRSFNSEYFYFCDPVSRVTRKIRFFQASNRVISVLHHAQIPTGIKENYFGLRIQREKNVNFDLSINMDEESYFLGSFISPEYWGKYRAEILREITRMFYESFPFSSEVDATELAIHIRRGDYLSNEKARKFHGICTLPYYRNSVFNMLREFPDINSIQIFSDEIEFAEEFAEEFDDTGLSIRINSTHHAPNALAEMSASKYFVGCNSTFSWWASALNNDRISVLPSQWFLDPERANIPINFFQDGVRVMPNTLE